MSKDIALGTGTEALDNTGAELATLRAERHRWQSEQGRLRKEQEKHNEAKQRVQQLEDEIATLRSIPQDKMGNVGDYNKLKDVFDDEGAAALKELVTPLFREVQDLREQLEQKSQEQTIAQLRGGYQTSLRDWESSRGATGLLARVSKGGDLNEKWAEFAKAHPTVDAANSSLDANTMAIMLDLFVKNQNLTFEPPTVTPQGGGYVFSDMTNNQETYTPQDYQRDTTELEAMRRRGEISEKEFNTMWAEAKQRLSETMQKMRQNTGGVL